MSDADDGDMLAAEYVLGTLDAAERAAVAARLDAEPELALAVRAWEDRLSPLVGRVPDMAPPADAYAGIAARLFGEPAAAVRVPAPDIAFAALRRRLRRWQGSTAGLALLAAALLAWVAVRGAPPAAPGDGGGQRFAAVLQRDAGAPAMLVEVDLAARQLTLRPLAAEAPAGRAYELWIIDPSLGAPRSLGLVPARGEARDSLRPYEPGVIAAATYAVTVEPPGGSPTGRPTTAPVLSGKLVGFPP